MMQYQLTTVISLLLAFTVLQGCRATYYFYVEVNEYSNPQNKDKNGNCCDLDCSVCENYFIFCLRQSGYDQTSNTCPYGVFSTSGNAQAGSNLQFSAGTNLDSSVTNPLQFAGNTWPGGFQLKVRALDADIDQDDTIENWILEDTSILPNNEWSSFTTLSGLFSSHATIRLRVRLRCRGNWHGHNCDIYCLDQNTETAHLECALDGSYVCMEGWQDLSTQCTVPVCSEGCHSTGGSCNVPGECICNAGWSGALCDQCSIRDGCVHGYCTHPNDCTCDAGYEGTLCNIDVDPCGHQTPCENGVCTNLGPNSYSCNCTSTGYTGTHCEVEEDGCNPDPCQNGATCINERGQFQCVCPMGWTGDTCSENIDECMDTAVCLNGGTCTDCSPSPPTIVVDGTTTLDCTLGYHCECAAGYFGDNCSLLINHCDPNPCQNGAVCHDLLLGYYCACAAGYMGLNCETELDECLELEPCKNGATCIDQFHSYTCTCPPGFTGQNCHINIDDCEDHVCDLVSNSTCLDGIQGYTCVCQPGFTETLCDVDIDDCDPNRCMHGGECVDLVDDFVCKCPEFTKGLECEITTDGDDCRSSPCQNGGVCFDEFLGFRCQCLGEYTGPTCSEKTPPLQPSNPCANVTCGKEETCVADSPDKYSCEVCKSGLEGCSDSVQQSDDKSPTGNGVIIGSVVGGSLLLLLLLLLLLILCYCCCVKGVWVLCPCCTRDKVEENEMPSTLRTPYNMVHDSPLFLPPSALLASEKGDSLSRSHQNPIYGVPGETQRDSLLKVPLNFAANTTSSPSAQLPKSRSTKQPSSGSKQRSPNSSPYHRLPMEAPDRAMEMAVENLEEAAHHYEELEKVRASVCAYDPTPPSSQYQSLLESVEGRTTSGEYSSLAPQQPSAMLNGRPENPYILDPLNSTRVLTSFPAVSSPEVKNSDPQKENLALKDM